MYRRRQTMDSKTLPTGKRREFLVLILLVFHALVFFSYESLANQRKVIQNQKHLLTCERTQAPPKQNMNLAQRSHLTRKSAIYGATECLKYKVEQNDEVKKVMKTKGLEPRDWYLRPFIFDRKEILDVEYNQDGSVTAKVGIDLNTVLEWLNSLPSKE